MHGRILINDDFGTGKSVQALALALAYRMEWPLLILCPAFLKYSWRYEILKWLPGFDIDRIQILANEREPFRPNTSILIVNFDLATHMIWRLQQLQLKVCIVDEAQWFSSGTKNFDRLPKVNLKLMKVAYDMKRVILLSALNCNASPARLHALAKVVRPDLIPNFYEFGYRYCDPRQSFNGIDFSNVGNLTELKQLLEKRLSSQHKRKSVY
mmetsp:Transcript_17360/g.21898  ORF Transcript_17360/g.21898 Transcript_17360/m.21898 type:complete len:211 (-) Transcript_17360:2218-2850(-)